MIRRILYYLAVFATLIILVSLAKPSRKSYLAQIKNQNAKYVYLVKHGWHAGIVISVKDIPEPLIPEKDFFGNVRYLEIGWGDSGFYQANNITASLTIKALFSPTKSVMHVAAFNHPVRTYFSKSQIIKLKVTEESFYKLIRFVHNSFDRNGKKKAIAFSKGRYGYSFFFKGIGSYHIFQTCNRWVAQALQQANIPIHTLYVATSESVMSQARYYGEIIP